MDPRTTTRPKVKPKPDTDRPTGIASLAAWLGRLPLPAPKPRQDRREAWIARREARGSSASLQTTQASAGSGASPQTTSPGAGSGASLQGTPAGAGPSVAASPVTAATLTVSTAASPPRRRPARAARPVAADPLAFPAIPPSPMDELPDLAMLVAAADGPPEAVPAWVTAEAPRMLFDMPGPGEAVEGQEFFRLFRQNADGLSELARLAGDRPAEPAPLGDGGLQKERPWWRFAAR